MGMVKSLCPLGAQDDDLSWRWVELQGSAPWDGEDLVCLKMGVYHQLAILMVVMIY